MYNNSNNNTNSNTITAKSKFKRNRSHKPTELLDKNQKDKPASNAIEAKKNEILAQPLQKPQSPQSPQSPQLPQLQPLPQVKQLVEPDSEGCSLLSGTNYETCKTNKKCGWNPKANICFKYPNPNQNQNPNQQQYQQQNPQQKPQYPPPPPPPPPPQFKPEILKDDMFDLSKF